MAFVSSFTLCFQNVTSESSVSRPPDKGRLWPLLAGYLPKHTPPTPAFLLEFENKEDTSEA